MLVWIVIAMPTGAGKSTLFKFLKGILLTVRRKIEDMEQTNGNGKVADWVIEEASMEKMGVWQMQSISAFDQRNSLRCD